MVVALILVVVVVVVVVVVFIYIFILITTHITLINGYICVGNQNCFAI